MFVVTVIITLVALVVVNIFSVIALVSDTDGRGYSNPDWLQYY